MKSLERILYSLWVMLFITVMHLTGQNNLPVVTNVNARVMPDGLMVDITYDVADSEGDSLYIEIQLEVRDGSGIVTRAESMSGDIGHGIIPGSGKQVTWNAALDMPNRMIDTLLFIVYASDKKISGGTVDTINDGYGTYLRVPAGEFLMGANSGEGYIPASIPVHRVYLDEYYIGKFEITNADFVKFVEDNGYTTEEYWTDGGYGSDYPTGYAQMVLPENANFPVTNASWYAAHAYCRWLSSKTSHAYSLPTEAEWEKAARGTDQRIYPHGNTLHGGFANYRDSGDPFDNKASPVGLYDGTFYEADNFNTSNAVSPYGAYDMCGNALEMCLDWFDNYYFQTCFENGVVINPRGPTSGDFVGEYYVTKGGGYFTPRSSQYLKAGGKTNGILPGGHGFRCVIRESNGTWTKSNTVTIDTRVLAEINALEPGPSPSTVRIPENGTAYVYQKLTSQGHEIITSDTLVISLRNSNSQAVNVKGHFIAAGLLRMDFPFSGFDMINNLEFFFPDTLRVDSILYSLNEPKPSYNITTTPGTFSRSWDVFAGGSAGVSGSIGSIGLGASASMAKLSISGEAGIGLKMNLNEKGELMIERRVDYGISEELEAPQVNYVIGEVNVGKAQVAAKTVIGQSFQFTDLEMDNNLKRMAQSGFMLETFSLGGLAVSPFTGIIILAITETINTLGNVNTLFKSAAIQDYWGVGVEGSFGVGLKFVLGEELEYDVVDESFGGAIQAKYVNKHRSPGAKVSGNADSKGAAGSSLELELAASYNISVLPFSFELSDGIELGSGNFSLFDGGLGGSLNLGADRNSAGEFDGFSIGLKGGGEYGVLGDKENIYYNTKLEFSGEHINTLKASSTSIGKMFSSTALIPLGPELIAQDAVVALEEVINAAGQFPVRITTAETRGKPYELGLGVSFDIAAGVGIGGSLGVKGSYFDELEYPRKVSDVYIGQQNYLLSSSEYSEEMHASNFFDILDTLFSGTLPLVQAAFSNLVAITEETLEAGEEFILEIISETGTMVGEMLGQAPEFFGKLVIGVFSANSPRITQKAFSPPEVRHIYNSSEVYHGSIGETGDSVFIEAGTTLTIVSEAITVGFVLDGDTVSVTTFDTLINLKIIIYEEFLVDNGFSAEDRDQVKVYFYEPDSVGWILQGGMRDADTISVEIQRSGTYALGIELDPTDDLEPPEIYNWGTSPVSPTEITPMIFAHITDSRYGSGLDLASSHLVLDGDTLDSYFDPNNKMIFYQVGDSDQLEEGMHVVEIIAVDLVGNMSLETFQFMVEKASTNIKRLNDPVLINAINYPNPFSERTFISIDLPAEQFIEIFIYDYKGAYVKKLTSANFPSGKHIFTWDGTNGHGNRVAPGAYFYQVRSNDRSIVRKMQYTNRR